MKLTPLQNTHQGMVLALSKSNEDILRDLATGHNFADMLHMAIGMAGEIGEVSELVVVEPDRDKLIIELGDVEYYLAGLCKTVGFSLEVLYKVGYGNYLRNTDVERSALLCMMSGLAVLDSIKKTTMSLKELDTGLITLELSYVLAYLEHIRNHFKITREEVLEANIAKLSKRYSKGTYSNQQARERADITG